METMFFHIGLSPWSYVQGLLHNNSLLSETASGSDIWRMWPFEVAGKEIPFLVLAAKVFFLLVILAAVALFLRFLFGPGGPMREPWMTETKPAEKSEKKGDGYKEP